MDRFSSFVDGLGHFFREVFDPFELLYMSIAIATLDHTIWAAAFLFEGSESPGDQMWRMKGLLIAIAVDLGMLLTSRFLQKASGCMQVMVLTISFVVAAVTSFYFQMVYIMFHTPIFEISKGVDTYWVNALTPFLNARVVLLPLALPILATVYTCARIFQRRVAQSSSKLVTIKATRANHLSDLARMIELARSTPIKLASGQGQVSLKDVSMDLEKLTWFFKKTGKAYGPYKNRATMISAMQRVMDMFEGKGDPAPLPDGNEPPGLPSGE